VAALDEQQAPAPRVPLPLPPDVERALRRGRAVMKRDAAKRRLCMRFERGDTFWFVNERSQLDSTPTITAATGGGKPPHKIRNSYNFIRPIVDEKVSAATQRVPNFEIDPSTTDPEDAGAAKLSEKVSIYGYYQWRLRKTAIDTVKTAVAHGGAGYALPYWEPNVGPYVQVDGEWVGQGDVRVIVLNGNEVYWEAGSEFDSSPWWAIERARLISDVKHVPGYVGGELAPDARTSDIPTDRPDSDQVMVTELFERPCPKWPAGRWFTVAAGKLIVDARLIDPRNEYPWADYPLKDPDGTPVDAPLLHRLVYTHDPDDDDDLGLVWQLIDFQRAAQDCINKMLEYKNRGLNLQMLAPVNSLITRPDDVPNSVRYYKLSPNGEKPEWEDPPSGQILNALQQIFNLVIDQMQRVAAYEDVQAEPNVAARTTQAVIEQSIARWQSFLGDLAEWWSGVMRHCLNLVARYYTEPRTLEIRGRMGWESIADFKGAKLMGQTNVRVSPGSLEYLTKAQILSKVQYYAAMGWLTGERAMAAVEGGMAEKLTEGYDQDVAKVNRIMGRIRDGSVMEMPTRQEMIDVPLPADPVTGQPPMDPQTGQPATQQVAHDVPIWMPNEWDNIKVWQQQLALWLKTQDFELLAAVHPDRAEVAKLMWAGLEQLEQQQAVRAAQQQQAMAQSLGMGNAAAPQGPPTPPSLPNAAGMPASGQNTPGSGPGPGHNAA
jgi:hypothetical protein